MRKSNKILLSALLTLIVLILAVHFTLHAKFSAGAFTTKKIDKMDEIKIQAYTGVSAVKIASLNYVEIRFSDTLKVQTDKETSPKLKIGVQQGTLTIIGETDTATNEGPRRRSFDRIVVYLPYNTSTEIDNCEASIHGKEDSASRGTYNFKISETALTFSPFGPQKYMYSDSLNIEASKRSNIQVIETQLSHLNLTLRGSQFNDNGSVIGTLKLDADDASNVSLTGANVRKLKP